MDQCVPTVDGIRTRKKDKQVGLMETMPYREVTGDRAKEKKPGRCRKAVY